MFDDVQLQFLLGGTDAYRLKVGTLPSGQEATMILELEICFTDRYLTMNAEVLEGGERYGHYQMLLEVRQSKTE